MTGPWVLGITGGIGSGKSLASNHLANLGVSIVDADVIARQLLKKDGPVTKKVLQHFGAQVVTQQGELDRAKLRKIIFYHLEEKQWLENLMHPIIREKIKKKLAIPTQFYHALVSPLLLETSQNELVDHILVIDALEETQTQRVRERDNCSSSTLLLMIQSQISREKRLQLADDVILNDGSIDEFTKSLNKLHLKYSQNNKLL